MNISNLNLLNFKVDYYSILKEFEENNIFILSQHRLIECIKLVILISINEFFYSIKPYDYLIKKINKLFIDLTYEIDKLAQESRLDVYEAQTNTPQLSRIYDFIYSKFNVNESDGSSIPESYIQEFLMRKIQDNFSLFDVEIFNVFPYADLFIIGLIPMGVINNDTVY